MTLFSELPVLIRIITGIYELLFVIASAYIFIKNIVNGERSRLCIYSFPPMVCSAILLQGMADLEEDMLQGESRSWLAGLTGNLPWFIVILMVVAMIFWEVNLLIKSKKFKDRVLTAEAVKESLDNLPDGICFSTEGGTPVLVNVQMNRLCGEILDSGIVNAEDMWHRLQAREGSAGVKYIRTEPVITVQLEDGTVWDFRQTVLTSGKKRIREIVAFEVTRQYELNHKLRAENERLQKMNLRLQELCGEIKEITREKEILETRIRVHDEIGRALLVFQTYLARPARKRSRKDLLFWCRYIVVGIKSGTFSNPEINLERIVREAKDLDIKVICEGELPEDIIVRGIFLRALKECISNTAKHAGGTEAFFRIINNNNKIYAEITNNGIQPSGEIREKGGLKNLRSLAETAGGEMKVSGNGSFMLRLEFPGEKEFEKKSSSG